MKRGGEREEGMRTMKEEADEVACYLSSTSAAGETRASLQIPPSDKAIERERQTERAALIRTLFLSQCL